MFDLLSARYLTVEQLQLWDNYVHDKDLKAILKDYLNDVKKNAKVLENLMEMYSDKLYFQDNPDWN